MTMVMLLAFLGIICLRHVYSSSCSGNTPHKLQFNIKFDGWAQEVSWAVLNENKNMELYGNGTYSDNYQEVEQETCIKSGCYTLELNDTYGDGIYSYAYFGWFTLKLNSINITLGEQTFDGDQTDLYFCTQLFDTASSQVEVEFITYDYNSEIYIVSSDTTDYVALYANQYEFPDYINGSVSNKLYLTNDRSSTGAHCYKIIMDNGYVDTNAGYYEIKTKINGNHDSYTQTPGSIIDYEVSLCKNDSFTSAPTPAPTFGSPDVHFNVGHDNNFKSSSYLGCPSNSYSYGSSCSDTKTWKISGECINPRLTMNVYQSDYDWYTEAAYIYINDKYVGNCEPLNDECTYSWQTCNITEEGMDISSYLMTQDDEVYVDIGLTCSSEVNICGIGMNGTDGLDNGWYYCLGEAVIECDATGVTPSPTPEPTSCRPNDEKYNLTLTIEFDDTPEDIWWIVYEYDTCVFDFIWYDFGNNTQLYRPHKSFTYSTEIRSGCYWILFLNNTKYDEDTSPDFYGYYAVDLNGLRITHGKEPIGPAYNDTAPAFGVFEFCTTFVDVPPFGAKGKDVTNFVPDNSIEIKTYNFDGEIIFVDDDDDSYYSGYLVWGTIYSNTEDSDFHGEEVTNIIPVAHGCYLVIFYSYVMRNNDDYWYSMTLKDLNNTIISRVDSEDGFYSYVDFCTNNTGADAAVTYQNKYTMTDCTDDKPIPLKFDVKFDDWPEEVSWNVTGQNSGDKNVVYLQGNGNKSEEFEDLYHPTCIPSGCYLLEISDSYGDGMTHYVDDYGWYRLYLDNREITLGKQAVEKEGGTLYFCTSIFDGGRNNVTVKTIPEKDKYSTTNFSIFGGEFGDSLKYQNDYIIPDFEKSVNDYTDVNILFLTMGCYILQSNNYFTATVVGQKDEIIAEKNEDTNTTYETEICGVNFDFIDGNGGSGHGHSGSSSGNHQSSMNTTILIIIVLSGVLVGALAVALIVMKWKRLLCFKPGGKYDQQVDEEVEM